ncbi:MAG: AI-2E family transporter [Pirellulales bacterium]|nr:AI-2E family transporter [Pirellulales bacterium]
MSRWVSFIVLASIVVLVAVLFFQVMASFILPMFFALILVVMFRPLHRWMTERCGGRVRVAAGITTAITMLIVFLPLLTIVSMAATDGVQLLADFDREQLQAKIDDLRDRFDIRLPAPQARLLSMKIDEGVAELQRRVTGYDEPNAIPATLTHIENAITSLNGTLTKWRTEYGVPDLLNQIETLSKKSLAEEAAAEAAAVNASENSEAPVFDPARPVSAEPGSAEGAPPADDESPNSLQAAEKYDEELNDAILPEENTEAVVLARVLRRLRAVKNATAEIRRLKNLGVPDAELQPETDQLQNANELLQAAFRDFEWQLMGGGVVGWLKLQAYPSDERLVEIRSTAQEYLLPLALSTPKFLGSFVGRFLFGLVILIISLYYFLADGPKMVAAIMRLSPLDDRYEARMLHEFDKISRAMVVATLLSAVVQGILAGIGYYVVGLNAVFLLTVTTMILSMVPFVGAASVWGACSIWLLFDNQFWPAVALALYGALVVSMIDNFIKPYVLHGRSNLHPLLALLSVLGGVQALGPIGIFVGPMVVAFLQALLEMLRGELDSLENPSSNRSLRAVGD